MRLGASLSVVAIPAGPSASRGVRRPVRAAGIVGALFLSQIHKESTAMSPPDDSLPAAGWRAGSPVMTRVEGGGPWSGSRVVTGRLRAVPAAA